MMDEKDAERLGLQLLEICENDARAENLRCLEELMITQVTAPCLIGSIPLKSQIEEDIFYYKFLKGIISSYNPGYIIAKKAA